MRKSKLQQLIIGNENPTQNSHFVWNMLGSAIYSLASMVLTYLTIRIVGGKDGGVFAIALTLAQMFINIAYYEMRNYQVTDARHTYQFADYHAVKICNCIMMILVTLGYSFAKGYSGYKLLIVCMVCIYRMLDGYADVYEAAFHDCGRLDLAGKSMAFRTILSVCTYFIVLIIKRELSLALLGAIVSGIIGVIVWDVYVFKCLNIPSSHPSRVKMIGILKNCFPLFLGMFLWTYLLSASRIAVDDVMSSEYQSYYQALFLPVSVINLFVGFLMRPSLKELTQLHEDNNKKDFWKRMGFLLGVLGVFTVFCMVGAYLVGIPVIDIIVGCDLSEYRILFVFLIFAGGMNATAYLFYFVLTIFRESRSILLGYIVTSLLALAISKRMVIRWALWGAAWSYLISITILTLMFVISIIVIEKRR